VGSPPKLNERSPTKPQVSATTAQDLLNDVMGLNTRRLTGGDVNRLSSSHPGSSPSTFLFNSDTKVPGQTIWSAAQDEQALKFSSSSTSSHVPVHSTYHHSPPTALDLGNSPWTHPTNLEPLEHLQQYPGQGFPPATISQYPPQSTLHSALPVQPLPIASKDPFGYYPSLGPQLIQPNNQAFPEYMNPQWDHNGQPYHSRHLSLHESQAVGQPVLTPATAPMWGGGG
jgi:hypothetical protein